MSYSPRKKSGFLSSPVVLILIGLLTAYVLFQVWDVYSKKQYTKSLLEESKTYYSAVSQSLIDVEEKLALLDDTRGKDAYVREKEGMVLSGEEVYVIVDTPKLQASSTLQSEKSWIKRIIPFWD